MRLMSVTPKELTKHICGVIKKAWQKKSDFNGLIKLVGILCHVYLSKGDKSDQHNSYKLVENCENNPLFAILAAYLLSNQ